MDKPLFDVYDWVGMSDVFRNSITVILFAEFAALGPGCFIALCAFIMNRLTW